MSESDHGWCRDVRRDEQVRAAEDAAAVPAIQHRDLPEQVALLWASLGDLIGRVVRLEGEFDAGADLTAERDAALRDLDAEKKKCEMLREDAVSADIDIDALRSQRDAARCDAEKLKARVAELEATAKLAPAANAGGESPPPRGWLTAEEREAVEEAMVDYASNVGDHDCERIERVLRALLARETPPRVEVPPVILGAIPRVREQQWHDAIRAAGGEVE